MAYVLGDGTVSSGGQIQSWNIVSSISGFFMGLVSFVIGFIETLFSPDKGLSRQGINRTGISGFGSGYRKDAPIRGRGRIGRIEHDDGGRGNGSGSGSGPRPGSGPGSNSKPLGRPGRKTGGIDHSENCYGST